MFKREILDKILLNIETSDKPILITGARQVGKTTVVKELCNNFEDFLYINLESDTTFRQIVEESELDFYKIMDSYSIIKNIEISNDTLIVFDEVQICSKLLTGLKYFYEAKVPNKIIATGSNLGLSLNFKSEWSFPVGKVNQLKMYPMTFKEFLIASGNEKYIDFIFDGIIGETPLDIIHESILKLFDVYINVGGMPEVVSKYVSNGSIQDAIKVQGALLSGYTNDILKYADPKLSSRIYDIYNNVDVMLSSDTQKFKITKVDVKTYKDFATPLAWLINTGLVHICSNIESVNVPLRSNIKENNFKLFLSDTGLLMKKSNYIISPELIDNNKIYLGMVIENYFATVLKYNGLDLFCYKKNSSEIDFVMQDDLNVIPIEVKSGNNTKAKSLKVYLDKYKPKKAYKFSRNNFSVKGITHHYPVYSFEFIKEFHKKT